MDVSWYLAAYLETLRRARRAVAQHLGIPDAPGAIHALVRSVNTAERAPAGWAAGIGYRVEGVACRLDVPGSSTLDLDVTASGDEVFDARRVQAFIGALPVPPPPETVITEALEALVASGELVATEAHRYALAPGVAAAGSRDPGLTGAAAGPGGDPATGHPPGWPATAAAQPVPTSRPAP